MNKHIQYRGEDEFTMWKTPDSDGRHVIIEFKVTAHSTTVDYVRDVTISQTYPPLYEDVTTEVGAKITEVKTVDDCGAPLGNPGFVLDGERRAPISLTRLIVSNTDHFELSTSIWAGHGIS